MTLPKLSIVVPVYNEQESCKIFCEKIREIVPKIPLDYEIIFVNDGSQDQTLEVLNKIRKGNKKIKIIDLTRNFGKEIALTAGLENAFGEAVIPIDVDMQDPPELIPQLVQKWQEGFEVVLAGRKNRDSDTFFKKTTASMFYWLVNKLVEIDIPSNVGDYRLMDQKVIKALRKLPERTRFMKGIFAWLGFRQTTVYYTRANRLAGQTKFKFWKLWNLALEGFFSFTAIPLKLWTYLGFLIAFFSMAYMVFIVATTLIFGNNVPGYASLMVFILFFNGLNMMGLGVLGEYLARTFVESKQRPLYLIRQKTGFDKAS